MGAGARVILNPGGLYTFSSPDLHFQERVPWSLRVRGVQLKGG